MLFMDIYHGTNKTALASQERIASAFNELLAQAPYSSISISAICKEADISRQTFYSLFSSKENIILYELGTRHSFDPGKECCCTSLSLSQLCHEYTRYIVDKKDLLALLVRNDLIYLMHESLYDSFISCSCFLPKQEPTRRAFGAEFIAGGMSGIAKIYIQQGELLSEEELEENIYSLFSGQFFEKS